MRQAAENSWRHYRFFLNRPEQLPGRLREESAESDYEQILKRARMCETSAEEEREKVQNLQRKLSQNYEHLERCTRDNARLSDELVEKSKEADAATWALMMS